VTPSGVTDFTILHLSRCYTLYVSHSNDMTSCQSSAAENVSCNVAPFIFISPQCGDTTSFIRQATFFNFKGKRT